MPRSVHAFLIVPGDSPDKLLLLVDGSSYLYRAFHALPELKSPRGEPTGAIFGVLSMLKRLASDYAAQARACVFDAKGKTFRDEDYPEYKAHRPPMPDDLAAQIAPLKEAIEALGWPVLSVDGVEADDVIATLAEQATMPVDVVTGDRDLFQLIDDARAVRVLYTGRGVARLEIMDDAALVARYGILPVQYADFATLRGDPSDGLPGVPGIGEKTAASLLARFGTLEALLGAAAAGDRRLSAVSAKLNAAREYLVRAPEVVRTARSLVLPTIDTALPHAPRDAGKLAGLGTRWGIANALDRATRALRLLADT